MSYTLELVTFDIFEDAGPGFLDANSAINEWLRQQEGFVSRQLARRSDGGWIDIVTWTDETSAKTAAARMPPEMGHDAMRALDSMQLATPHPLIGLAGVAPGAPGSACVAAPLANGPHPIYCTG